jgi:hypothetical protein
LKAFLTLEPTDSTIGDKQTLLSQQKLEKDGSGNPK